MRQIFIYNILAASILLVLSACQHDEPRPEFKPVEERRVLLLTGDGHVYDQTGKKIMDLPNCEYASEIIGDGDDFFVSGKSTKDRVGYWKNGKWNTLHIDFFEDVEHETEGIGKWDTYIFLYDYPNILRNSGIFPLEDCERFNTSGKCMSVSNGKCYIAGNDYYDIEDDNRNCDAVYYYERKGRYVKEILPKPSLTSDARAFSIYAYDTDHTVVGGFVDSEPAIWVNKELQLLPRIETAIAGFGCSAVVSTVTRDKNHIYAGGYEYYSSWGYIAILWIDGVPQHLVSNSDHIVYSEVMEVIDYDGDLYALTYEMIDPTPRDDDHMDDGRVDILLWYNGNIIAKYNYIDIVNFAVI